MAVDSVTRNIMPGAEPFAFEADGDLACVLVHGFTGSPHEVLQLGRHLADQGVTTRGVLLSGHGTSPEEMARFSYRHWLEDVQREVDELQAAGKRVFICGMSMGGTLALNLAARRGNDPKLAGLIVMGAPLRLVDWRLSLLPILALLMRWHTWGQPDIKDRAQWERHVAYKRFHVRALKELLLLVRETRQMLPRVHQPLLVVFAREDHTVPPSNAQLVMDRVSSPDRRLLWLENCYHVVTLDFDCELLQREVTEFVLTRARA